MDHPFALQSVLTTTLLLGLAGSAFGQPAYPAKPIRVISPYAAGGATRVLGQLVGQRLTESWGQQVLTDNRPGGSGVIAAEATLKPPPDGHTIMLIARARPTELN